ncbi:hypothetical protein HMPREF9999_02074 [Alloprevotella sp. oral taxon 473 str. F0040]|nr:hypothetical protein HMPREF9999_02074 [Alloprevotella sp. oral taxon 473 str. F0040]
MLNLQEDIKAFFIRIALTIGLSMKQRAFFNALQATTLWEFSLNSLVAPRKAYKIKAGAWEVPRIS